MTTVFCGVQFRVAAAVGTATIGTVVAIANYYGDISYDIVSGKKTTMLMWLAPLLFVATLICLLYTCFSLCLCRKEGGCDAFTKVHQKFFDKLCCWSCCRTGSTKVSPAAAPRG